MQSNYAAVLTATFLGLISIFSSGCADASESGGNSTANANSATVNTNVAQSTPPLPPSSSVPNANPVPASDKKASVTPPPQIGSGGDDLSLFTQVRGALSSDSELSTAVIIEVKQGVATLKGNVSSEAQKAKAGQIVRNVNGIKNVKNDLRVAP